MARKPRPLKVKRYRRTFDSRSAKLKTIKQILIWIFLLAVIFFGAFLLAKPVVSFFKNLSNKPDASSSANSTSVSEQQPQEQQPAGQNKVLSGKGVFLSADEVRTADLAKAKAAQLKAAGVTFVMVQLKDADGTVQYNSTVAMAQASLAAAPIDTAALLAAFKEQGISVAASIYAYQDAAAAYANRDAAVHYRGQDATLWLDNDPAKGGKPWLNPYSEKAQQYISDLVGELCEKGFTQIALSALQYPNASSLAYTTFGSAESSMAKEERLSQTLKQLTALAEQKGASLILEVPYAAAAGNSLTSYVVNPLSFGAKQLLITVSNKTLSSEEALKSIAAQAKQAGTSAIGLRYAGNVQAAQPAALAAEFAFWIAG